VLVARGDVLGIRQGGLALLRELAKIHNCILLDSLP
jgi:hypothetical protein